MSKKLKILYVEDDPIVLNSVYSTLKLIDFIEVDIASDGLEGFNLCNLNDHYDMLITDIRMPKLSGLELLKKIKTKNINPYTIIVSAFNDKDYLLNLMYLNTLQSLLI